MSYVDTVTPSWAFNPEEEMPQKASDWTEYPLSQKIDETCKALAQFGRRTDKYIDRSFFWIGLAIAIFCSWFNFMMNFPASFFPSLQIIHVLITAGISIAIVRQIKILHQHLQVHGAQRALRLALMEQQAADTPTESKLESAYVYVIGSAKHMSEPICSAESLLDFIWDVFFCTDNSSSYNHSVGIVR